jgi:D-galactarolactone cycloisomerase
VNIAKVEPFVVGQDLKESFYFSQWEYKRRETCLVRITTDNGAYGWGEGYGPAKVVSAGIEFLTPLLLGENPLEIETLWNRMHRRSYDYARSGVLVASLSALDVALWDLTGKLLDKPVCDLLGGRRRDSIEVYATGMYFARCDDLPARLASEAAGYVERGFASMKMKVGLGVEEDVRNVQAVREAIGPKVRLMADANHAFDRKSARELAMAMTTCDGAWIEDPQSQDDYAGYRDLRAVSPMAITAGECEYLRAGFQRLFAAEAVDIAQPDICAAGGLTEALRIADLAREFGVPITPHCWGSGVAFAAAAHFMAALDASDGEPLPPLEMDQTENPLRDKLITPGFRAEDGRIAVPTGPGLGVDVALDVLSALL